MVGCQKGKDPQKLRRIAHLSPRQLSRKGDGGGLLFNLIKMINTENYLEALIQDCLQELNLVPDKTQVYLDIPQDSRFGDLTTNVAMQLSRQLKKPPREIASVLINCIKQQLPKSPLKDYIKEIKVEGAGFINFYFNGITGISDNSFLH